VVCGYQFSDKICASIFRVDMSSTLKIEAVCSSEKLVIIYRATLLYNPEEHDLDVLLFVQKCDSVPEYKATSQDHSTAGNYIIDLYVIKSVNEQQ
jgi:hypothetical protein